MDDKNKNLTQQADNIKQTRNNPSSASTNEKLGFYFSSSLKIYDPNTKEVLINKRAD